MPEQKGKRRNRGRRRVASRAEAGGVGTVVRPESVKSAAGKASARPATGRRPKRELPIWGNVIVALLFIGVGLYLTLVPVKGEALAVRLIFFAGYVALSGLYWFKAYRQFQGRRSAA